MKLNKGTEDLILSEIPIKERMPESQRHPLNSCLRQNDENILVFQCRSAFRSLRSTEKDSYLQNLLAFKTE